MKEPGLELQTAVASALLPKKGETVTGFPLRSGRFAGIRTLGPLIKSQLLYQLSYEPLPESVAKVVLFFEPAIALAIFLLFQSHFTRNSRYGRSVPTPEAPPPVHSALGLKMPFLLQHEHSH